MVLIIAVTCAGCKKTEAPKNHSNEKWLNPLYNPGPGSHGGIVQKMGGTTLCSVCHGKQLQGQNGTPGCATCHFGPDGNRSPNPSVWQHGTIPHASLAPYQAVCNACHDLYRSYALGPKTCHNCHEGSTAPHQTGQPWLDRKSADFHGASTLQCSSCHDQTTKCATCHFGPTGSKVPLGSNWQHGTIPHESVESYQAVCNQCHTLDRSYGNGPNSCHNCHGDGWWTPHGSATTHLLTEAECQYPLESCYRLSSEGMTCSNIS